MARLQGISGGLSGKTGSYTFRQSRGQTIVSQYQPVVKNPNTQGQQNQRAKFKLMSQLAAIMSPGFGTMGVTKRPGKQAPTQRNAFVQLNMPLVEVTSDNQEVVAKIPMEQVKLTTSFRNLPDMTLTQEGEGLLTSGINVLINNIAAEVKSVRLILVGYSNNVASIMSMMDAPVEGGSIAETLPIGAQAAKYTVLGFGLIPSASAKTSTDLNNIHTPADEDFISAIELNAMVMAGDMVETKTVGANITINV